MALIFISDPSYPLVNFFFFFFGKKRSKQIPPSSLWRETWQAQVHPCCPYRPSAAPPSAGRWCVISKGFQADRNTMTPAPVLSRCLWNSLWNLDVFFCFLWSVSPWVSFIKVSKAKVN